VPTIVHFESAFDAVYIYYLPDLNKQSHSIAVQTLAAGGVAAKFILILFIQRSCI